MPDNSATHLIFFIAAIIIAISLVGVFTLVINDFTDAVKNRSDAEQKAVRSRVEIINDLVSMPYNNTSKELEIYVKNTGSERLDPNQTIMFIDGMHHNYTFRLVGGGTYWTAGSTVIYTVKDCYFTSNSDHTVKVSCQYDASDSKRFRIGSLP
jgi:archaellum component FlaG (FlaF/FlaG flagellin family)